MCIRDRQNTARCRYLPDILAKFKHCLNPTLSIHNAANAKSITHALVNAVLDVYKRQLQTLASF